MIHATPRFFSLDDHKIISWNKIRCIDMLVESFGWFQATWHELFTSRSPRYIYLYFLSFLEQSCWDFGHLALFQIFNLSSPGRAGEPNTREAGWPQGLAPSLERLCALCKELDSWLNGASNRVVVLHTRWIYDLPAASNLAFHSIAPRSND